MAPGDITWIHDRLAGPARAGPPAHRSTGRRHAPPRAAGDRRRPQRPARRDEPGGAGRPARWPGPHLIRGPIGRTATASPGHPGHAARCPPVRGRPWGRGQGIRCGGHREPSGAAKESDADAQPCPPPAAGAGAEADTSARTSRGSSPHAGHHRAGHARDRITERGPRAGGQPASGAEPEPTGPPDGEGQLGPAGGHRDDRQLVPSGVRRHRPSRPAPCRGPSPDQPRRAVGGSHRGRRESPRPASAGRGTHSSRRRHLDPVRTGVASA